MLKITQGDTVVFNFTAKTAGGTPVTLTGASFQTQMKSEDGDVVTFGNSKHTANPNQVTNKGKFTLTLTAEDSASIGEGANKDIVTKITIGSQIIYYHGNGILTVLPQEPVT